MQKVSAEFIQDKIYFIRGYKVMIDSDLANLYDVPTKSLNLAVKRNSQRFPEDFMFRLTVDEMKDLRFQIETSSWGGRRYLPYVFTQEGIAMLSSVLTSERAIQVNIAIMRAFVQLKEMITTNKKLAYKLEQLEKRIEKHDKEIIAIFEAIRRLMAIPTDDGYKRSRIGFVTGKS